MELSVVPIFPTDGLTWGNKSRWLYIDFHSIYKERRSPTISIQIRRLRDANFNVA